MPIPVRTASDPRLTQGRWLRIPGPTVVHPDSVKAQTYDMLPHRGPGINEFMLDLYAKLRTIHKTEQRVLVFSGSGSSGWEAGIVNLLSPGDTVVVTVSGWFGHRFAQVAGRFGLDVHRVEVPWGTAVSPDQFAEAMDRAGSVKGTLITHNETSTGVTNPLQELAAVARERGALVLVDAVSSAAAIPLQVDAWDLDWAFSGTQKAWMCPPGLMIAAVSERAMEAARHNTIPRFFFDLQNMADAAERGGTATTGSLSLFFALDAAVDVMLAEGLDNLFARHERLGGHFRAGLERLGIELLPEPGVESNSVTAFHTPGGMTSDAFQDRIGEQSGIAIATSQGEIGSRVNRVGHMGFVDQPELDATLEAIEMAMRA